MAIYGLTVILRMLRDFEKNFLRMLSKLTWPEVAILLAEMFITVMDIVHFRNQTYKIWKSKPISEIKQTILEIKRIISEIKRINFGNQKINTEIKQTILEIKKNQSFQKSNG